MYERTRLKLPYPCFRVRLQVVQKAADIQDAISEGANSFLWTEYKYLGVFMVSLRGAGDPC